MTQETPLNIIVNFYINIKHFIGALYIMIYDGDILYTLARYEYLVNKKEVYDSIVFSYEI
jgi:hypothetical protein